MRSPTGLAVNSILYGWLLGILGGSLAAVPYLGVAFFVLIPSALLVSMPVVVLVVAVFIVLEGPIRRNLLAWCCAAPFIIVAVGGALFWSVASPKPDEKDMLLGIETRTFGSYAFLSTAIASYFFWRRHRLDRKPG